MAIRVFSDPVRVLSIGRNPVQVLLIRSDPVRVLSIRSDPIRSRFCKRPDFTAYRSHFDLNFFAKMDRDYLATFIMLLTLSVIFIVNDDSFARKEFAF